MFRVFYSWLRKILCFVGRDGGGVPQVDAEADRTLAPPHKKMRAISNIEYFLFLTTPLYSLESNIQRIMQAGHHICPNFRDNFPLPKDERNHMEFDVIDPLGQEASHFTCY